MSAPLLETCYITYIGKLKNQESEKLFLEIMKVDLYKNPQKKAFRFMLPIHYMKRVLKIFRTTWRMVRKAWWGNSSIRQNYG